MASDKKSTPANGGSKEALRRKAAELGLSLKRAEGLARKSGLSVASVLDRLDTNAAFGDFANASPLARVDGPDGEQAGKGAARSRRKALMDSARDRRRRVRVRGHVKIGLANPDNSLRFALVPSDRRYVAEERRFPTREEFAIFEELRIFVASLPGRPQLGLPADAVPTRLIDDAKRAHVAVWSVPPAQRWKQLVRFEMSRLLMFRQAGSSPLDGLPRNGAEIITHVRTEWRRVGGDYLPSELTAGMIDRALEQSTLGRGGRRKRSLDAVVKDMIRKVERQTRGK